MDTRLFKTWLGKFGGENFKDFLVFLVFLFFSTLFWMVFTLSEVHESTVQVELKLTDVPQDIVITEPLPAAILVQVQDRGMSFMHYWMRGVRPVEVPYTNLSGEKEGRVQVPLADVQRMLRVNLLESSKVLKITPDSLEYWYNQGGSKVVPLVLCGQVTAGNGHVVTDVDLSPHHVSVIAPRQVLDTLSAVYTMPTCLANLQESRSETLKLRPVRGAKFETETARVEAQVDILVEKSVTVPVQFDGFPEGTTLRLFPTPDIKVVYSAGYTASKDIEPEDFSIRLSYDQILELQRLGLEKIPMMLSTMPPTAVNVHLEPSEVDYLLESTGEQGE